MLPGRLDGQWSEGQGDGEATARILTDVIHSLAAPG